MQVIKLWQGGIPDKMLAVDSLPPDLLVGVSRGPTAGWGRIWEREMKSLGGDGLFHTIEYGPGALNKDIEIWEKIKAYIRKNVVDDLRLMDNIENMVVSVAPDSKSPPTIEPVFIRLNEAQPNPNEVPVIVLKKTANLVKPEVPKAKQDEEKLAHTCKNLGRGGRFEDGCPRCDQIKKAKEPVLA